VVTCVHYVDGAPSVTSCSGYLREGSNILPPNLLRAASAWRIIRFSSLRHPWRSALGRGAEDGFVDERGEPFVVLLREVRHYWPVGVAVAA
jgi:hypothetical protein